MIILSLLILSIFGVGLVSRTLEGSWLAPASFFPLLWAAYVAVSALFVSDPGRMVGGVAWILLSCGCVACGSFVMVHFQPRIFSRTVTSSTFPWLRIVIYFIMAAALVQTAFVFLQGSFSLGSMLSFTAAAEISANKRSEFDVGEFQQGSLDWLAQMLMYCGTFFGGILTRVSPRRRDKVFGVLTLFAIFFSRTLYGSRMGVLFGGAFWLSSFLVAHIFKNGPRRRSDTRFVLYLGGLTLGIMIGLSLVTMSIRYFALSGSRSLSNDLAESFIFVPAFCYWFNEEGHKPQRLLLGYRTFCGVFESLGIYHDVQFGIAVENTGSNIFTAFRDAIEDFGHIGSCLYFILFGIVGSISYRSVVAGKIVMFPILIVCFACTFVSTSFSLFLYNAPNTALALFLFYFYMKCVSRMPYRRANPMISRVPSRSPSHSFGRQTRTRGTLSRAKL